MQHPNDPLIALATFKRTLAEFKKALQQAGNNQDVEQFLSAAEKRLALQDSLSNLPEYLKPYTFINLLVCTLAEIVSGGNGENDSEVSGICDESDMHLRATRYSTALNTIMDSNSDAARRIWSENFWEQTKSIWRDFKEFQQNYRQY